MQLDAAGAQAYVDARHTIRGGKHNIAYQQQQQLRMAVVDPDNGSTLVVACPVVCPLSTDEHKHCSMTLWDLADACCALAVLPGAWGVH